MEKLPTIKQLQCFLAVAEDLNFRRAAEKMRMTQPPLTRQIQCLEDIVGCSLFTRNTHQVHLTQAGIKLETDAKHILSQLSQVIQDIAVDNHSLQIGMTHALNFTLIPNINKHLEKWVDIDSMLVNQLTSKQLLQSLKQGNFDIVLTGEKPTDNDDFDFYWLHQEPLMLALPSQHQASTQKTVSLEDVADLPLFWFNRSANSSFYNKCEAVFTTLSYTLKRLQEPDDSLLTLTHVARGKGMALMPQSMCQSSLPGLCYRPLDHDSCQRLHIDVYAVTHKDEARHFVLAAIDQLLSETN